MYANHHTYEKAFLLPDYDSYDHSDKQQSPDTAQDDQHDVKLVETVVSLPSPGAGVIRGDHPDGQAPRHGEVKSLFGSAAHLLVPCVRGHKAESLVD